MTFDLGIIALFVARGFLGLGVLVLVLHFLRPWLQALSMRWTKWTHHSNADPQYTSLSSQEVQERQSQSRDRFQIQHTEKAASYTERILRPRQEARQRKQEEEYHRFTGPAWKGDAFLLGGEKTGKSCLIKESSSKVENPKKPAKSPKKGISLPDEPSEDAADSINVVLRTPQGRSYKRRFLTTCTIQVLLDYMTLLGYHQSLYTLSTSYPRSSLTPSAALSLQVLGLEHDVTLNIEAREDDDE